MANTQNKYELHLEDLVEEISAKSDKYDEKTTTEEFKKSLVYQSKKPLTIASYISQLKEKDEDKYFDWMTKWRHSCPEEKLLRSSFTDGDVADYFESVTDKNYITFDNELYYFNGVHWVISNSINIKKMFEKWYFTLTRYIQAKMPSSDHTDLLKKCFLLRNTKKYDGFIKMIEIRTYIVDDVFDLNPDLLGFQNGTFDLSKNIFREGRKEDFITMICPYDYEELPDHELVDVENLLAKIMPIPDEREYLLRTLSTGLRGATLERFIVFTGKGRNGKGVLCEALLPAVLGKLQYLSNNTVLTEKIKSDMNVSIANMNKKRMVFYNEPAPNSSIKVSMVKEITGGGKISFRSLYSKNTDVKLHGTHILSCNKKPLLDEVDDAIAMRLIIIPFRSTFQSPEWIEENDAQNDEFVFPEDRKIKSEDTINELRLPMMNLLLKSYKKFREDGYSLINTPRTIKELAKEYLAESDPFVCWFRDSYEKTGDENDFVKVMDVCQNFKRGDIYFNMNRNDKRRMTQKQLIEDITSSPSLRRFYREEFRPCIDGKRIHARNILLKHRLKQQIQATDDEDEE